MEKADNIIRRLQLQPHPEGGFYRETYRSKLIIEQDDLSGEFSGRRNAATCIYFLLTSDSFSAFHRIIQDEMWHFYQGSAVCIHMIDTRGEYSKVILGHDLDAGELPQFVIEAGVWFAANVVNEDDYSLVGCTVAPGFDFRDFTLAEKETLLKEFPRHEAIISLYTIS